MRPGGFKFQVQQALGIRPEGLEIKSAFGKEKLCGTFQSEGFSGADIQGPDDSIEIVLCVDA
jgi:hypothetical protein